MDPISQLHDAIGEETLRRLVNVFYQKIRKDDLIGPMYPPDDWDGAEKRLADFIIYRFGGTPTYITERGHPRLRARHFPFSIGINERDRWLALMSEAISEVAVPLRESELVLSFFTQVADSMRNRAESA